MSEVRKIEVKRGTLAMYRGLGYSSEQIAETMGIKKSEVDAALRHFGMLKERAGAKKDYEIVYIDDVPAMTNNVTEEASATKI